MALLLALLLAVTAVSRHAAIESHQADYGIAATTQLLDSDTPDEPRLASCAPLPPSLTLADTCFPLHGHRPSAGAGIETWP